MSRMFVPGPVDVADDVLQAQTAPMLPHRSKEFEATFRRASEKAQQLFCHQNVVKGCNEENMDYFNLQKVLSL